MAAKVAIVVSGERVVEAPEGLGTSAGSDVKVTLIVFIALLVSIFKLKYVVLDLVVLESGEKEFLDVMVIGVFEVIDANGGREEVAELFVLFGCLFARHSDAVTVGVECTSGAV